MATCREQQSNGTRSTPRNFPLPITEYESSYLVEKLVEIAVAEVFAYRNVFKQKRFKTTLFLGESVTMLKDAEENADIMAIFNGIRNAIRKSYLRAVLVTIGVKTEENELEPEEAYKFTIGNAKSLSKTDAHSVLLESRRAAAVQKLVPFLQSLRTTLLAEPSCESTKRHFIITLQLNKSAPNDYRVGMFSRNYTAPDTSSLAEFHNEVIETRFHVFAATAYVPKQHSIIEWDAANEQTQIASAKNGEWSSDSENVGTIQAKRRNAYVCASSSKASDESVSASADHSDRRGSRQSREHDNSQSSRENASLEKVILPSVDDSTAHDDSRMSFIKKGRRSSSSERLKVHDRTVSRIPVHDYEQTPACGPLEPVGRVLFLVNDRTNESFANLNGSLVSIGYAKDNSNIGHSRSSWNIGSKSEYYADSDDELDDSCVSQENVPSFRDKDLVQCSVGNPNDKRHDLKRVHFSEVVEKTDYMGERVQSNAISTKRCKLTHNWQSSQPSA